MRKTRLRKIGLASLLALSPAAAWSGSPAAAAPPPLQCGQTITRSTTLANDVGPCSGPGIVVGADGITLDLAGHRIFGDPEPSDDVGIDVSDRTGVTVKGGEVTGFGTGVAIQRGSGNTVSGVASHDNVGLLDASGTFGDGIAIFDSSDNLIASNAVSHNGPFDGIGVFGATSRGNRLTGNTVDRNDLLRFSAELGEFLNLDDGINLGAGLEGSNETTITRNVVTRNGLNGIDACSIRGGPCQTTHNVIAHNRVEANGFGPASNPDTADLGDGIHVVTILPPGREISDFFPPTYDLVVDNTVRDNALEGIVVGSSNNKILYNVAVGNAAGFDDFYDLDDLSLEDCDSNIWRGNTFGTAFPPCTTVGGRQVGSKPSRPRSPSERGAAAQRRDPAAATTRRFPR